MVVAHTEHPGHFDSPLPEQRSFLAGTAVVDVSDSDIVCVSGSDRLVWLDSLISQRILGLQPGICVESLILDPKGHIEHAFFLTDDGSTTWLLTSPTKGEALSGWLASMKFRMDVTVTRDSSGTTILAHYLGPESAGVLDGLGEPVVSFRDPWPVVQEGSVGYAPEPHPGGGWALTYVVLPASVSVESLSFAGSFSLEAAMIAAGRPTLADVDEKSLPHEFDWLRSAVHLNKGCYRGQETVAKVHNLGHPPRRLTLLHLDGSQSQLPRPGDPVMLEDTQKGHITRAAWHHELGPIALALLKRTTPTDVTVSVISDGVSVPANQEVLVTPDAGASRGIPRLPRLGQRS